MYIQTRVWENEEKLRKVLDKLATIMFIFSAMSLIGGKSLIIRLFNLFPMLLGLLIMYSKVRYEKNKSKVEKINKGK